MLELFYVALIVAAIYVVIRVKAGRKTNHSGSQSPPGFDPDEGQDKAPK